MRWISVVMCRDQCEAHGMLPSGSDHDDRFGLSTHGRHGEEFGRARDAANVADSTAQRVQSHGYRDLTLC